MASQAELRSQIAAINSALTVLRRQLAQARPATSEQTQLSISIFNLEQDRSRLQTELNNITTQTNPPDPQVPAPGDQAPLRIDITGVGEPVENDPQVNEPPDTAVNAGQLSTNTTVPAADPQNNRFVFDENGELIPADSEQGQQIIAQDLRVENTQAQDIGGNFVEVYDVETGRFNVENLDTGEVVDRGLTEQEAILRAQERSVGDPGYGLPPGVQGPTPQTQADIRAQEFATAQANTQAIRERARVQATLSNQIKQAAEGDWRVKLRLAPGANYLYRGSDGQGTGAGILQPLAVTDGVVFPYTPLITTRYVARYNEYDLTHSNYRGYFYGGSHVEELQLQATFTAQDTYEANYLLAVITFFKSVTKMFYGQDDTLAGTPPPLVFLQGLGQYQFNLHPCAVSSFNYNLPSDVDYIRADVQPITGFTLQQPRQRQDLPTNVFSGALQRLLNAGLPKGGVSIPPAPGTLGQTVPTYVPTKMEITVLLLPIQSRRQVSKEFSLQKFSNGNLIKGGFW